MCHPPFVARDQTTCLELEHLGVTFEYRDSLLGIKTSAVYGSGPQAMQLIASLTHSTGQPITRVEYSSIASVAYYYKWYPRTCFDSSIEDKVKCLDAFHFLDRIGSYVQFDLAYKELIRSGSTFFYPSGDPLQ